MMSDVTIQGLAGLMLAQASSGGDAFVRFLGEMGPALALGLAAAGSCLGIAAAGQSAAGAWAKESKAGRPLTFTYIIFMGAPISQTLYAMIIMNRMRDILYESNADLRFAGVLLGIGLATGIGELLSAWGQGRIGAAAIRTLSEGEGKGFAFLIIAIGIIETVGIFVMVFMLTLMPTTTAAAAP